MIFTLNDKNDIPWLLIEMREHAGLTQRQASKIIGVRQSTLSAWELGRNKISLDRFITLVDIYDSVVMINNFS